jgi:hypothetical protein
MDTNEDSSVKRTPFLELSTKILVDDKTSRIFGVYMGRGQPD